jgi:DNA-directed RNA polymerase specialized sigma24 family protein
MSTILALDQITTRWSQIGDPLRFVMLYSQAIRAYLSALLGDAAAAEEACQEFLANFLIRGLDRATPDRGRFRDYLKVSVRNTAISMLRRKHDQPVDPVHFVTHASRKADDTWTREWQRVILEKAWRFLEAHERTAPASLYFTALRLSVDHSEETSEQLAVRATLQSQRTVSATVFRKQLSRARLQFAQLIIAEVTQTLGTDARLDLAEELAELGLLVYVREYLP